MTTNSQDTCYTSAGSIDRDTSIPVGLSAPLGATVVPGGVNFSVFSRNATRVELLLFDEVGDHPLTRVIEINAATNRTADYWHVFVPRIRSGQPYGYRIHGPFDPQRGIRFNSDKLLLDPYGRGVIVPSTYTRAAATNPGENAEAAMKSVVIEPGTYDWEGDCPLDRPAARSIIHHL